MLRNLLAAALVALAIGAVATPALADDDCGGGTCPIDHGHHGGH